MPNLNDLRVFLKSFFHGRKSKDRKMKRVFQWRRYLEWRDLTPKEKLSAKRFLLIPVFVYLITWTFNQNFTLIILFLTGYVLYKKYEKGDIIRK